MASLKTQDILALSFMTFALFVGAGNIIFPPIIGLQAGPHVWTAALGFLITAVGLPVITIVALARVGGPMDALSGPIGRVAGGILAAACYLLVGPLFATPRTATASFEAGVAPLVGDTPLSLFIYTLLYFLVVLAVSLYPGKLLDTVGRFLAPLKILALGILGVAAFLLPHGTAGEASPAYQTAPFAQGFVNGYLTMDTLGALVFGIVIVNAIRSKGVDSLRLITRYAIIAGLSAGVGLALVYISLFRLGASSHEIASHASNGAAVLHVYIQTVFGDVGSAFFAILMFLACLVTAVGLTCACAEYFSRVLPISYRQLVFLLTAFALLVSNLGLTKLIQLSEPVLGAIYPPCIVMVALSFCWKFWHAPGRVVAPAMAVALIFGVCHALADIGQGNWQPAWLETLPLTSQGLAWLLPVLIVIVLGTALDAWRGPSVRREMALR